MTPITIDFETTHRAAEGALGVIESASAEVDGYALQALARVALADGDVAQQGERRALNPDVAGEKY